MGVGFSTVLLPELSTRAAYGITIISLKRVNKWFSISNSQNIFSQPFHTSPNKGLHVRSGPKYKVSHTKHVFWAPDKKGSKYCGSHSSTDCSFMEIFPYKNWPLPRITWIFLINLDAQIWDQNNFHFFIYFYEFFFEKKDYLDLPLKNYQWN